VFSAQQVGLKVVDGNVWLASFMDYGLGHVDLKERSLRPLVNPFAAVKV